MTTQISRVAVVGPSPTGRCTTATPASSPALALASALRSASATAIFCLSDARITVPGAPDLHGEAALGEAKGLIEADVEGLEDLWRAREQWGGTDPACGEESSGRAWGRARWRRISEANCH